MDNSFAAKTGIGADQVLASVEKRIGKYFAKRGEHVVQEKLKCVREGSRSVREIPWELISWPAAPTPGLDCRQRPPRHSVESETYLRQQ